MNKQRARSVKIKSSKPGKANDYASKAMRAAELFEKESGPADSLEQLENILAKYDTNETEEDSRPVTTTLKTIQPTPAAMKILTETRLEIEKQNASIQRLVDQVTPDTPVGQRENDVDLESIERQLAEMEAKASQKSKAHISKSSLGGVYGLDQYSEKRPKKKGKMRKTRTKTKITIDSSATGKTKTSKTTTTKKIMKSSQQLTKTKCVSVLHEINHEEHIEAEQMETKQMDKNQWEEGRREDELFLKRHASLLEENQAILDALEMPLDNNYERERERTTTTNENQIISSSSSSRNMNKKKGETLWSQSSTVHGVHAKKTSKYAVCSLLKELEEPKSMSINKIRVQRRTLGL